MSVMLLSPVFIKSSSTAGGSQRSYFVIKKYLHQCLPVTIEVPEHDDPQVKVLASFYCSQQDLSFLLSLRNT